MALDPLLAARIVFILGITNIIGLALVFISCRCILGWRPQALQNSKLFMAIYRRHCWYWRFFLLSVLAHTVFAFLASGNPL